MPKPNRRSILKASLGTLSTLGAGCRSAGRKAATHGGRKIIVLGFDGMDPLLCEQMLLQGRLPNLDRLRREGGYRRLGTSTPPQSPVAWANFINGAGPGSHGIFDFIHRDPERQCVPFFAVADTDPGSGQVEIGRHKMQLPFWPFRHRQPQTILRREGIPFWDFLDEAGIPSTFYNLPSNYPPSPSRHGHHRCLSGMGTPDLLGTYGTYQFFEEGGPEEPVQEGGGMRCGISFDRETSQPLRLIGPDQAFLLKPEKSFLPFTVHRDTRAEAAILEIQGQIILLKKGQWSRWIRLTFYLSTPALIPDKEIHAICRFYLPQVSPVFQLYVTPLNADPGRPVLQLSEPPDFVQKISSRLGLFYNTGFQEDHKALSNRIFHDDEFVRQADYVLEERLRLLDYALRDYQDGLLFFYFSSTDLQSHMLWWDTAAPHPYRSESEAKHYFDRLKDLYVRMDAVVGDLIKRYGNRAHLLILSDHGFGNFRRQFNVNTWLRDHGYLGPADCTSVLTDTEWSESRAFALGLNGIYLNLKGRERHGIVEPGEERERLLAEIIQRLEEVKDADGRRVIRKVYRSDREFAGSALRYAPDLIVGYARDYRCSWAACLGDITQDTLLDNDSAWAADHCMDASEMAGILFSNRPIKSESPALIDLAPSILKAFGCRVPSCMTGKNIL